MKYEYPLTAIFNDGDTVLINNQFELQWLINEHGWFGYEWAETEYTRMFRYRPCVETLPRDYEPKYFTVKRFEWIVRDDFGQKVDPNLIELDWAPPKKPWWYYGKRKEQQAAAEKGLPIPYIRSHRRYGRKKYKKHGGKHVAARNAQSIDLFINYKNGGEFE